MLCSMHPDLKVSFVYAIVSIGSIWKGDGFDLSNLNKGTYKDKAGTEPDTMYGMSEEELGKSYLPKDGEHIEYDCYVNYRGDYYNDSNLRTDLDLSKGNWHHPSGQSTFSIISKIDKSN